MYQTGYEAPKFQTGYFEHQGMVAQIQTIVSGKPVQIKWLQNNVFTTRVVYIQIQTPEKLCLSRKKGSGQQIFKSLWAEMLQSLVEGAVSKSLLFGWANMIFNK